MIYLLQVTGSPLAQAEGGLIVRSRVPCAAALRRWTWGTLSWGNSALRPPQLLSLGCVPAPVEMGAGAWACW